MVKDTNEKDGADRKRRKTAHNDSSPVKQSKEDIYENVIANEEREAAQREAQQDVAMLKKTCTELRKIFEDVYKLKMDNSEQAKSEIIEKRIQGSLIFLVLKKLNRLDKIRLRAGRDALHKEKLRVDSNRLQLQNLLYEANHLKREVHRCYQFKSQDEEIELVTEEEFYANAPEAISRPKETKSEEHSKRLARLEWELHQRKELSSLCKQLTVSKENVTKDITMKLERIDSLAPCLASLLKATKPLQSALDMNFEKNWEIQRSVRLLPRPLYLVYANLSAYGEACEKSLSMVIDGDEEENKCLSDDDKIEHLDDDDGLESDIEDAEVRKKYYKRCSKIDRTEAEKKKLFKFHALSVILQINKQIKDNSFSVKLRYFAELGFVTAEAIVDLQITGIAAEQVVSARNILDGLYPDDFGEESPNPKTQYQLRQYDLTEKYIINYLTENNLGKPYKWAQKMCGIEFIFNKNTPNSSKHLNEISDELIQKTVPNIIKKLKLRWRSRLSLMKQIQALENKHIDFQANCGEIFLVRTSSSLVQWAPITWNDYIAHPITQKFVEDNLVSLHNLFYRALVTRGSAKLECIIFVPSNFPQELPLWNLLLNWNGKHNAMNNPTIRDMEFWINIEKINPVSSTLSVQLQRAMSSFDIFLETEGPLYSPAEFTPEKTFLRAFRGRQRSRPFKIVQTGGTFIFKQL